MKKLLSLAVSAVISLGALIQPAYFNSGIVEAADSSYNYGEAMQKSLYFYQVQQAGELPDWNQVSWRDDSMLNDYIPGGWFDAGDHIKFALTNAYSSVMLAWGVLEYQDGLEKAGLLDLYKNNLQWALDFLVGCDLGDEVVYQIGEIGFDHKWWGSAEVYLKKLELMENKTERPYFTTKDSNVTGEMAAALAAGYLVFKDSNPDIAQIYLEHAKNCFRIADETRSDKDTPASSDMYKSSHFYDELFWAANWLYMATKDQSYLDLCETDYIPNLGKEEQSTELKYTWGMCWDDVQQGATLLYAINTGDKTWKNQVAKHLDYWTVGYGGKKVSYTPDGLAWLTNWGALRHATTTAFLAYVSCDELFSDDNTLNKRYTDFADSQMNYCFGDNNNNYSYVVGMGNDYPKAWHHRTSSGVWDDQWTMLGKEKQHAHILYGALVGGPNQNGEYTDEINQYQFSEVAIDYNAAYTASLCAMLSKYGGTSDPNFPPEETPKWDEFYIEACINQSSQNFTELKVQTTNHSAWPARLIKNLSYRYYMDLTELFDAGYTIDDITVKIGYDEFQNCSASKPIQYDGNIYYVEIIYDDGTVICPSGQSEHQGELQFRISVPDATNFWDPTNDYSYQGLVSQEVAVTDKITLYDNGVLIWGTEPNGKTPEDKSELEGDINIDGKFNIADLVMLNSYIIKIDDIKISEQGFLNGDMDKNNQLNVFDSVLMRKNLIK